MAAFSFHPENLLGTILQLSVRDSSSCQSIQQKTWLQSPIQAWGKHSPQDPSSLTTKEMWFRYKEFSTTKHGTPGYGSEQSSEKEADNS